MKSIKWIVARRLEFYFFIQEDAIEDFKNLIHLTSRDPEFQGAFASS